MELPPLDPAQWDPAAALTQLRQAEAADHVPALLPFYGHRGPTGTVGPWVLSQWHPVTFTFGGHTWPNAEAAMMAAKAALFGDRDAFTEVVRVGANPYAAKTVGRAVRGFDQTTWDTHAYRLVFAINAAKYTQHPALARYLVGTAPAFLVEASPTDRVWGTGTGLGDPATLRPSAWRGQNLLGFALTEVRDRILLPAAPPQ